MTELQPELVDLILKHLITIDTPLVEVTSTLVSCCLVSRTWRALSQPLLFSEVLRRSRDLENHTQRLTRVLSLYGYLKAFLTSLTVDVGDQSGSWSTLFAWIPQVQELVLVAVGTPDLDLLELWKIYPPSSRLTTLCVHTLNEFPIGIFYHIPALTSLHLIDAGMIGFDQVSGEPLATNYKPRSNTKMRPKLSDLYIFSQLLPSDLDILTWFLNPRCAFDLSALSTCHIIYIPLTVTIENHPLVERFFRSISTNIVRDVGFVPPSYLLQKGLDFPTYEVAENLHNLRSVKLVLYESLRSRDHLISWAALEFFPQLPHPEMLEELLIPLSFCGDPSYEASKDSRGWELLDALLASNTTSFCNLRHVHIALHHPKNKIDFSQESLKMSEAFQWTLPLLLPMLHKRGVLRVGLSLEEGYVSSNERRYDCPFHADPTVSVPE